MCHAETERASCAYEHPHRTLHERIARGSGALQNFPTVLGTRITVGHRNFEILHLQSAVGHRPHDPSLPSDSVNEGDRPLGNTGVAYNSALVRNRHAERYQCSAIPALMRIVGVGCDQERSQRAGRCAREARRPDCPDI